MYESDDTGASAALMTAHSLLNHPGCPREVFKTADRPWFYVGDVDDQAANRCPSLQVPCSECYRGSFLKSITEDMSFAKTNCPPHVCLEPYFGETDDALIVPFFWGACKSCGSVFWAKCCPPFARLRRSVRFR